MGGGGGGEKGRVGHARGGGGGGRGGRKHPHCNQLMWCQERNDRGGGGGGGSRGSARSDIKLPAVRSSRSPPSPPPWQTTCSRLRGPSLIPRAKRVAVTQMPFAEHSGPIARVFEEGRQHEYSRHEAWIVPRSTFSGSDS